MSKDEMRYLEKLLSSKFLAEEALAFDGAALVLQARHNKLICELVIEVRLPGWKNELGAELGPQYGFLWVYLQNISDEPLKVEVPEYILTGGLNFPWKNGFTLMANPYRGESGEVFSWRVPISLKEDLELLSSDVAHIIKKCRAIMAGN